MKDKNGVELKKGDRIEVCFKITGTVLKQGLFDSVVINSDSGLGVWRVHKEQIIKLPKSEYELKFVKLKKREVSVLPKKCKGKGKGKK